MHAFLKSGKLDNSAGDKSGASTSTSKSSKTKKTLPWVEKYRPKTVEDVVEQQEAVSVLKECIRESSADLPNLLFYGPPGTGKTSTILAASRQLFGDSYRERILEMNASDERGIQMIRDKVKAFSQLTAGGTTSSGKTCPPFKIVILDEADSMTHAAQTALRRTMERETRSTRFCLICNYVSRIIEPLTSRCTKFRFKPLNDGMIFQRLKYICEEEHVNYGSDQTLNKIVETSGGDMRRAITCLQSCAALKGGLKDNKTKTIDLNTVYEVSGLVPDNKLREFLEVCQTKNYNKVREFVNDLLFEAYTGSQILEQLNEFLINSNVFNNKQKAIIGQKLGASSYRLQEGGSEYLQLLSLANGIITACN